MLPFIDAVLRIFDDQFNAAGFAEYANNAINNDLVIVVKQTDVSTSLLSDASSGAASVLKRLQVHQDGYGFAFFTEAT